MQRVTGHSKEPVQLDYQEWDCAAFGDDNEEASFSGSGLCFRGDHSFASHSCFVARFVLRTAQQLQSPITLDDSPPKQTESKIRPVVPLIEPKLIQPEPVQPARNLLTLPRPSMEEAEPKIVAADLSQPAYSLPSFIQMAIENHPTLKSAGARIKVA